MSKCRNYKKMKKRRYARIKRMMTIVSVMIISVCVLLFGSAFASAHGTADDSLVSRKYYKSIVVNEGDSMWTIAGQYQSEEYQSRQEYIDEVMEINQMKSTTLYENQKLIVPYYGAESENYVARTE